MAPPIQNRNTDIIDALYDYDLKLPTDELILRRFDGKSPSVLARFQEREPGTNLPYAVIHARRAIEIGVLSAQDEMVKSVARDIADFDKIAAAAKRAETALSELINALDPNARTPEYLRLPLTTVSAGLSGDLGFATKNLRLRIEGIKDDAIVLWRARELADQIKANSERKSGRLSMSRKNDPKPEERAFLMPLAEMWTHLMGNRPGKSEMAERNPFLDFVRQSWEMAFPLDREERVFKGALRSAFRRLDQEAIALLIRSGPSWK